MRGLIFFGVDVSKDSLNSTFDPTISYIIETMSKNLHCKFAQSTFLFRKSHLHFNKTPTR